MTQSNARCAAGPQSRGNATSALMLSELQEAHNDVLSLMALLDAVTREPVAERDRYANARWRLSQASLRRRTLVAKIFQHLIPRVGSKDVVTLQSLQSANLEMRHHSAEHVGKWTVHTIEADWLGYCDASRAIRAKMNDCISAEKRILYPLLTNDAFGANTR